MIKYVFLFFSALVFSQSKVIKGQVKLNQNNVSDLFVYIIDKDKNIKQYTQTNEKGEFEIKIETTINKFLLIRGLDFIEYYESLDNILPYYYINLELKPYELDDVIVTGDRSIKKTGDTIRYKLKTFTNNNERVLIDVLKNLPGIEVLENGQIKYQGMTISNFYIDGDDFISKNYNIATQNIKNEIIDEIQILENDQPIKLLQGKIIPKQAALNITFKEDFKGKLINDLSLALGFPKLLETNYNNILIKKKIKSINFIKFNNIGKDYLVETKTMINGGFNKNEIDFKDNLVDVNTIGNPPVKKIRFHNNENFATSLNFSLNLNKNTDFKSNSFYVKDFVQNNNESRIQFTLPSFNFSISEQNNFKEKYNYLSQQFYIRQNNNKYYIDNDLNFKTYMSNKNATVTNLRNINQDLSAKFLEINNNFTAIKNIRKFILFYKSNLLFGSSFQDFSIIPGISKQLFNNNIDYVKTNQKINNQIIFVKNNLSLLYKANNSSYNSNFGNILSFRNNNTDILINDNSLPEFLNNTKSSYSKTYFQFEYIYQVDRFESKLKINPSLWHINGINKSKLLSNDIQFEITKKFKKENSYSFNYNFNNDPIHTSNIFENGFLSNYRNLTIYNLDYLIDNKNTFEFNLKTQRTIKLFFFNFKILKSYINSNYITNTNFSQNINITSYQLFNNKSEFFNTKATFDKYFFFLKSSLRASFSYSENNRYNSINNALVNNLNTNQIYSFSFKPTICNSMKLSSEYSYSVIKNINNSIQFQNTVIVQKSENSFEYFFKEYFSTKLTSELVAFKTKNNNTNHFLDFHLNYRNPNNPIEFNISYTNILNQKSYFLQQNDVNIISETNFFLRPSNILISVFYKF